MDTDGARRSHRFDVQSIHGKKNSKADFDLNVEMREIPRTETKNQFVFICVHSWLKFFVLQL